MAVLNACLATMAVGQEVDLTPSDFDGPAAVFIMNPGVSGAINMASLLPADTVYGEFEKGKLLPFVLNDTSYVSFRNYDIAEDEVFMYDTLRLYTRHPETIARLVNNGGGFTSIDVSKLSGLVWLDFSHNHLTSIDLSNNPGLMMLYLYGNQEITTLDVRHNPKLQLIDASMLSLTELDVTQNKDLMGLSISNTDITEINLDSNRNLYELSVESTGISELNTTLFPNLINLSVSYTKISDIDVTKNPNLRSFSANAMKGVPITYIDVTQCPNLTFFTAYGNALEKVDFSHNPNLRSIYIYQNRLTELDIDSCPNIIELICWRNNLTYAALPAREIGWYEAMPQNAMPIGERYKVGEEIDLSSQLKVADTYTTYVWKTGDKYPYVTLQEGVDYVVDQGVTRFLKVQPEPVFCEMTNLFFSTLSLATTPTTIWTDQAETSADEDALAACRVYAKNGKLCVESDYPLQVDVFDLKGVQLYRGEGICGVQEIEVPCAGLYMVRLQAGVKVESEKVMVL